MSGSRYHDRVTPGGSPRSLLLCTALTAGLLFPLGTPGVAAACSEAEGPGSVFLDGFVGGFDAASPFYAAVEGADALTTVRIAPGDCLWPNAIGDFATGDGTAVAGQDYVVTTGSTDPICDDTHYDVTRCGGLPPQDVVQIPTKHDTAPPAEPVVESFMFTLVGGSRGVIEPSRAPVHVVDTDGVPRASLEPGIAGYARSETWPLVRIPVFAAGGPASASVPYVVEPAADSPAVAGEDYEVVSPNPLPIPPSRVGFIDIRIVNDKVGETPETLVVTLPGGAFPSTITFTIEDNEESERPKSRFHHPRHKWRYKKSDYRIREFHVFASDLGPAGVVGVEFAIKQTRVNGNCQWLTRKGWQASDCQNREWIDMKYDRTGDLWLYRMKQLKSSVNTNIKHYTAFSRAVDGAENVESEFKEKRNANTFEIKRTKKRRGR
jgi:hypothetical protein